MAIKTSYSNMFINKWFLVGSCDNHSTQYSILLSKYTLKTNKERLVRPFNGLFGKVYSSFLVILINKKYYYL